MLFGPPEHLWNAILLLSRVTAVFFILLGSSYAHAGESIWIHNGSKIRWVSNGASRRAYYEQPRAGLDKIGIHPGQLLFEGYRRGNLVTGRAFTFKPGCAPLSFSVSANLPSETTIYLKGMAPKRELGCEVTSFAETDLQFDYLATIREGTPTNAPEPGGSASPPPSPQPPSSPPSTSPTDTPEACKKFPLLCN
jgi:hypothetical protein